MRNLTIFAVGALALILVGCTTLRNSADCATFRRAHDVADRVLNARCPIPPQQDAPAIGNAGISKPIPVPRPDPDTRPQ